MGESTAASTDVFDRLGISLVWIILVGSNEFAIMNWPSAIDVNELARCSGDFWTDWARHSCLLSILLLPYLLSLR